MRKIFSLILTVICVFMAGSVLAAPQVFIPQYGFKEDGSLKNPLVVNFDSDTTKEMTVTLSPNGGDTRTLVIACSIDDKVFTKTFNKGYNYALYKVSLRTPDKQELLVLSQGKRGTGKTALKDITIIGIDEDKVFGELPIEGFQEVNILNSPLQVRSNRTAVLFRDKVRAMLTIDWNETTKKFDILGAN